MYVKNLFYVELRKSNPTAKGYIFQNPLLMETDYKMIMADARGDGFGARAKPYN